MRELKRLLHSLHATGALSPAATAAANGAGAGSAVGQAATLEVWSQEGHAEGAQPQQQQDQLRVEPAPVVDLRSRRGRSDGDCGARGQPRQPEL